jgi:hypothetical protein
MMLSSMNQTISLASHQKNWAQIQWVTPRKIRDLFLASPNFPAFFFFPATP